MARRPRTPSGMESYEDLARKIKVLERELEVQREAIDKLKQMGRTPRDVPQAPSPVRKSA